MRVKVYRVRVRVYRVSKRPSRAFLKMQTPAPPLSRPRRNLPETVVGVGSGLAAGGRYQLVPWARRGHGPRYPYCTLLYPIVPYWATTKAPRVPLAEKKPATRSGAKRAFGDGNRWDLAVGQLLPRGHLPHDVMADSSSANSSPTVRVRARVRVRVRARVRARARVRVRDRERLHQLRLCRPRRRHSHLNPNLWHR